MNPPPASSPPPSGPRHGRPPRRAPSRLLAVLLAACGVLDQYEANVEEDASGVLIIDGEKIADAGLWEAAQEEGVVTMYSGQSEPQERALADAFEVQTGIPVELIRISTGRLFERIQSEHSAGVIEADVIRHTDRSLWRDHVRAGVLQGYCPPSVDKIVEQELVEEDCTFLPTIQSIAPRGSGWATRSTPGRRWARSPTGRSTTASAT